MHVERNRCINQSALDSTGKLECGADRRFSLNQVHAYSVFLRGKRLQDCCESTRSAPLSPTRPAGSPGSVVWKRGKDEG
jgi:hypothetical protein